jgi:hypothetical protein
MTGAELIDAAALRRDRATLTAIRARVARIADAVVIVVELIGVGHRRTVVAGVRNSVVIRILLAVFERRSRKNEHVRVATDL